MCQTLPKITHWAYAQGPKKWPFECTLKHVVHFHMAKTLHDIIYAQILLRTTSIIYIGGWAVLKTPGVSNYLVVLVYFSEDVIKADIAIKDLVIKNLSTFETEISHLELSDLSLELELRISDLRVRKFF